MKQLDDDIERAADDPVELVGLLLERASIRGEVGDYQRALEVGGIAVTARPTDPTAVAALARAQLAAHRFADARATLDRIAGKPGVDELEIQLEQATGNLEGALTRRNARADQVPDAASVTLYAAALREAGRAHQAVPLIQKAAQLVRSNTPQHLAWLLFQWGQIYEDNGQLATARLFFAEAHRRLPAHLETRVHLVQAMVGTGDREGANAVLGVLGPDSHPSLLALAASMSGTPENVDRAAHAWERYVQLLPSAFADRAARFFLTVGNNSKRALELALLDLDARDTYAARALVVDAALAEGAPAQACEVAEPLATAGTRREQFAAWRAFSACGRGADAERVANRLGIVQR